ncbi:hypothetical protein OVY01_08495 [Robbsia sp. Bb-Pol-6]|uniref:Uncharacterized protein n=1 Tax=Robbsia betulipollinis TaxID=2981849 RepID=A0ABT3ZLQ4_9BURK|nr:hypothetical protein [Robbsia betulipollinis]MCY0387272.1 hypothetical protein [Robbsia betulipollinis]
MAQRQQTDQQGDRADRADQEAARQQASAALIARAEAVVREIEFDMDRAARHWRRAKIDIRAATAKLHAAQEAEARRHFEDDLRAADLYAAEARVVPTSASMRGAMHSPMASPRDSPMHAPVNTQHESDAPTTARNGAPRKLRNLV